MQKDCEIEELGYTGEVRLATRERGFAYAGTQAEHITWEGFKGHKKRMVRRWRRTDQKVS